MKPHYENLPTTSTPQQQTNQALAQKALDQYFSTNATPRVDHRFLIGHQPTVKGSSTAHTTHAEAIGYGLCILVAGVIAYFAWKIERKLRAHAVVQMPPTIPTPTPAPVKEISVPLNSVTLTSAATPVPPSELPPLPRL